MGLETSPSLRCKLLTELNTLCKGKKGKKYPKSSVGGQCRRKKTPNPSYCPVLRHLTHRKQYPNRANPRKNGSAEGNPIEKPIGKEHGDIAPYMDIPVGNDCIPIPVLSL